MAEHPIEPRLGEIVKHFQFDGDFLEAAPYGTGHIHDTYAARFRQSGRARRYILQRINQHVFQNPAELMENIQRVTGHLRKKIIAAGGSPERETLNLVPALEGGTFHKTERGEYWRAYLFVEGAQTFEAARNLDHVYHAARAFGKFQELLSDFPVDQLYETIPYFHHTGKRFEAFVAAVNRDSSNRAQSAGAEIEFVKRRAQDVSVLVDLMERGQMPQRVIHNDTKLDNVMIDNETGEGVCLIDLDTVMPGLSLYDFGDAVRSGANPAAEDERDLSHAGIDLEIFERFVHGYLDAVGDSLTPLELDYLPLSAKLMTFECGMRFLTDYLSGDTYFKIRRENHNLDRCRTQFKIVQEVERKFDQMVKIVTRRRQCRYKSREA